MIKVIFPLLLVFFIFSCAAKQEDNKAQWQYLYDLGMSSYMAKNYSEAIANLFRASQIAPNEPKVWNALGLAYMEAQEYEKAERSFLKALEVDKKYTEARLNLGILYYRMGDYKRAIKPLKEAIENEAFPQKHIAFYYLGKTHQAVGNQEEYKKNLMRAVAYNPMFLDAQLELAQVYEFEEDYNSTRRIYQSLIDNGINDPALELSLGRTEYKLRNYAKAKSHIKRVLEDRRSSPQLIAQAYDLLSLILIAEQGPAQTTPSKVESETKTEGVLEKGQVLIVDQSPAQTAPSQREVEIAVPEKSQQKKSLSYKIQLGAFSSLESAKAWKSKLEESLNLKDVIILEKSGIYRVLYGNFSSTKEATKELTRLKGINLYGFIVYE
ncbi:MAG: tetratricopeptide repeat protein [Aquificaceae bacterium]